MRWLLLALLPLLSGCVTTVRAHGPLADLRQAQLEATWSRTW